MTSVGKLALYLVVMVVHKSTVFFDRYCAPQHFHHSILYNNNNNNNNIVITILLLLLYNIENTTHAGCITILNIFITPFDV
jgi:hypothetical protein